MRNPKYLIIVAVALFAMTAFLLRGQRPASTRVAGPTTKIAPLTPNPVDAWRLQPHRNVLVRELFRQGLFLREREAGMRPHDKSLGEEPATADLDVDVILRPTLGIDVTLVQAGHSVKSIRIPYDADALNYVELAARSDALWRGELSETLSKLGVRAPEASVSTTQPAATPDRTPTDGSLAGLNILSQFAAVRAAHQVLQNSPDNAPALDLLIRGYANLGQLTLFLWSPAHKVFAARSMLYAQRLVVLRPDARDSFAHRAYALAFAGLQGDALKDLETAAKLPAPARGSAPWEALLDSYCHYDTARLHAVATDPAGGADAAPTRSLAAFLAFLTIESARSASLANVYGNEVLKLQPDCLRVIDAISNLSGVGTLADLASRAPAVWWKSIDSHMQDLGAPPPDVKKALLAATREPSPSNWAAFATALVSAPATGLTAAEPSWNALGHIARDIHFVHAYRQANFLVVQLGVDAGEYVAGIRPLLEQHPYRNFIECYAIHQGGPEQFMPLLRQIDMAEPDLAMSPMIRKLMELKLTAPNHDTDETLTYSQWCLRYTDDTTVDLERSVRWIDASHPAAIEAVRELHRCSPFEPFYMAQWVALDWPAAEAQLPQWEQTMGIHPTLAGTLGRKYTELKRWPEAEKYLQRYLEVAPDYWAFSMLAANYLAQKDEAHWLATMKRVLDQPDYGLFHGRANQQVAEHFMESGRWTEALPYAQEGAETGAGWALVTVSRCYEGLGNWIAAENLIRQEAMRYDKPMTWLRFCIRTGHGDFQTASTAAKQYLDRGPGNVTERALLNERASYLVMVGDTKAAMEPLRIATDKLGDPYAALDLALLLDADGDTAGRDAALKVAIERGPRFRSSPLPDAKPRDCFIKLAILFQECLSRSPAKKLDLSAVNALIASSRPRRDKVNLNYFVGRFLTLRGDEATALPYLEKAAATRDHNAHACVMAWVELRQHGIDPTKILLLDDAAPPE